MAINLDRWRSSIRLPGETSCARSCARAGRGCRRQTELPLADDRGDDDPERFDEDIAELIALVESMHPNPAFLLGPMTRILAWNRAASAVLGSPDHLAADKRYLLRWLLVDPGEGGLTTQREQTARNSLARFRSEYARHAGEPEYEQFLTELSEHSPRFVEWWEEHEVLETQRGTKVIEHPRLGKLRLHHAQTVPTGQPELRLGVYAPGDEATRAALATL